MNEVMNSAFKICTYNFNKKYAFFWESTSTIRTIVNWV